MDLNSNVHKYAVVAHIYLSHIYLAHIFLSRKQLYDVFASTGSSPGVKGKMPAKLPDQLTLWEQSRKMAAIVEETLMKNIHLQKMVDSLMVAQGETATKTVPSRSLQASVPALSTTRMVSSMAPVTSEADAVDDVTIIFTLILAKRS